MLTWLDLNVSRHCSHKQLGEKKCLMGKHWAEQMPLASYGTDKKEGADVPTFLSVHSHCMDVLHISEISLIKNARRKGGGEL